jgi:hypothetical protein
MAEGYEVEIDGYDQVGQHRIVVFPTKEKLVGGRGAGLRRRDRGVGRRDQPADMLAFQEMYQAGETHSAEDSLTSI